MGIVTHSSPLAAWKKSMLNVLIETLGGLGLFILGMKLMTEGLQMSAGNRIRNVLQGCVRQPDRGVRHRGHCHGRCSVVLGDHGHADQFCHGRTHDPATGRGRHPRVQCRHDHDRRSSPSNFRTWLCRPSPSAFPSNFSARARNIGILARSFLVLVCSFLA